MNWRRVHNILGLFIAVPFIFWTLSGFFFTLYPIETIRGAHLRADIPPMEASVFAPSLSLSEIEAKLDTRLIGAERLLRLGKPVWKLQTEAGWSLRAADTGLPIDALNKDEARQIARSGLVPQMGDPIRIDWLAEDPPREYRGALPAWVLTYQQDGARVYMRADTGEIVTIRTRNWRIFDIFWRFHILDMTGEDKIDTWWMKLSAFLAFAMVVTGLWLLGKRLHRGILFR